MKQFAVLHAHSEFSTRDSLIRATELASLAAEAGFAACALTDHGGVEGAVQFHRACREVGVKPIIGCEIYVGVEGSKKNHHLTVLAKNANGFVSLQKALSYGHKVGWDGKRRAAVIPINYVLNNLRDCIVLSGCASSPFWREVDADATGPSPDEQLGEFVNTFGRDFFFEVQPIHDWSFQIELNKLVLATAHRFNRPVVVTSDCHFGCADDYKLHEGLLAIASAYPVGHEKAWKFSTRMSFFMTPEEMATNLERSGFTEQEAIGALCTTDDIAVCCSDWDWDDLPKVPFPIIEGDLRIEAYKGLAARSLIGANQYTTRLDEELAVFEKADLPLGQYMLLVRECVRLFKAEGACIGPRGSVGGSLVGYLLGLCELDPIKHGLPWQRFYAPGRCFPKDTLVMTDRGEIPISIVRPLTDRVKTRNGWRRVLKVHSRPFSGVMSRIRFLGNDSKKRELISTLNHYIIRGDGELEAGQVEVGQDGFFCLSNVWSKNEMGEVSIAPDEKLLLESMQGQITDESSGTVESEETRAADRLCHMFRSHCDDDVESSGLPEADMPCTTRSQSPSDSSMRKLQEGISWAQKQKSLFLAVRSSDSKECVHARQRRMAVGSQDEVSIVSGSGLRSVSSISQDQVHVRAGNPSIENRAMVHAGLLDTCVEPLHRTEGVAGSGRGEAQSGENPSRESNRGSIFERGSCRDYESDSPSDSIGNGVRILLDQSIPGVHHGGSEVRVVQPSIQRTEDPVKSILREKLFESLAVGECSAEEVGTTDYEGTVYDLTIEDVHEYFANGILVHNCGWPDVDIDVDDAFRKRVPTVLRQRFGDEHVAQLSTYGQFGIKSAVNAAARAYAVDLYTTYGRDSEPEDGIESYEPYQRLIEQEPEAGVLAKKLVGRVQQFGAHAGGFVVTAAPVIEGRGAIVNRSKDKTLNWDMHAAEELGYVKLDFLGNASLSALRRIEVSRGGKVEWDEIPLDDEKVYDDFAAGRTAGIPQFLTSGMRVFVETLNPSKFDDLVWANAAFRPGGLGTMKPAELIRRYRKDPGSVIVYQEDVMEMCVGLAGFTWGEADAVRKVVAKSRGTAEFQTFAEKFVAGCLREDTLNESEARELWTTLADFGRYAFNKAHSASYSWNGYRIAWSKRYHSLIAFCALLNIQSDKAKEKDCTDQIVDEADEFGVLVRPAHVNKSGIEWVVDGDSVRAPLHQLPHGDARIAKAIMRRRDKDGPFKDEADFKKRMGKIKRVAAVDENAFRETNAAIFAAPVREPKSMIGLNYKKRVKECQQCDLRATCKAPVPAELNDTNVLIVGDKPGGWEDSHGRPFVGEGGKLLVAALEAVGIKRKDVSWTTAIHCKPPYPEGGGEQIYVDTCPWLGEEIQKLQPPLALAVGRKTWQKMGGSGGIMKANATVLPGLPLVVGCVSPNAVLHDPALFSELERAVKKFAKLYRELHAQRKGAAHANAQS